MQWTRAGADRLRAGVIGALLGVALVVSAATALGTSSAGGVPAPGRPSVPVRPAAPTPTSVAPTGDGSSSGQGTPVAAVHQRVRRYSLLQMNLCLSGVAGCFDDTQYPKVVGEAVDVIVARKPDAVTINEACSGDVARIAEQTSYHARFSPVMLGGRPLRCVNPGRRGVYGNAVLTKAAIDGAADEAFAARPGKEERRWICVESAQEVDVCTTHLSTRGSQDGRVANDSQCEEFAAVLAARDDRGIVIAAGDVNRRDGDCAPARMWARSDADARQWPGVQHAYGSAQELAPPRVETLPATYSDHDFLLVRTRIY